MIKFVFKVLLLISLITASSLTYGSLIKNGSFEQTTFSDHSSSTGLIFNTNLQAYDNKNRAWDVFYNLPGWETTYGNGIELQKNIVTRSQDGSHHIELDSHPRGASNAVMTQTLNSLTIGADYLLEFYYKPRTKRKNDNGINVYWYDTEIDFNNSMEAVLISDSTRRLSPNWALQSVLITAQTESMNLSFGSFGKQNTLGGLIDNVSLKQVATVPEPPMAILFLTAIILLIIRQRKLATVTF